MTVNDEIPEVKNKDFINIFSRQMICVFFWTFFLRYFFLSLSLVFRNYIVPDTYAVCGSAQTPVVIGRTGPCDPTADFIGWTVFAFTAIKTLLGSISLSGVAIKICCLQPWRRLRRQASTRTMLRSALNTIKRADSFLLGSMVSSLHYHASRLKLALVFVKLSCLSLTLSPSFFHS